MSHLLGIDIGTSGTKALICNADGKVIASATASHDLLTPKPGWTEQHPEQWWEATVKAVRSALRKSRIKSDSVRAIGLSGQMHGSVFLDRKGKVIRPALLWNDQRTARQCDDILRAAGGKSRMLDMTGNLPLTGYTAPKLLWLRDNEPRNFARLSKLLLPKDYVRYRMTGEFATDVGDACGTLLVDPRARTWNPQVLSILKIDRDLLPTIHESPEVTGILSGTSAKQLGLAAGTPVVAGAGDVMAGAVGNGIVQKGRLSAMLGTSGVVCAHSDLPVRDDRTETVGRVATMCHAVPGKWVVYGCMLSAAGSLQWYADELAGLEKSAAERGGRSVFAVMDEVAAKAPPGCEGLFFLPYLTGERCPHPDPQARGAWVGLTRRSTRAMMIRALLEGVTFGMRDILSILRDDLHIPVESVRITGGGVKSRLWRQMQANIYNSPIVRTTADEGGAFGVALLAGVGTGIWKSVEEACRATIREVDRTRPIKSQVALYERHYDVYASLYPAMKSSFAHIAALND